MRPEKTSGRNGGNMKNILKKVMAGAMALALLAGVLSVSPQIQAASKLAKADFNFTGSYKSNMNAIIKSKAAWTFYAVDTINEKSPKKCVKTKRGITLTSTKKQVFKKYGKASVKKLGRQTKLYKQFKKKASAQSLKVVEKDKCAVYQYKSGSDKYQLHFFFDSKNKVEMIMVNKNC